MNDAQFLSVAWTQLIQVSLLTVGVWLLTKLFARNRPHLAHAMWLVVLAKCVTPPLLASPTGLFGHLSVPEPVWFEPEEIVVEEAIEPVIPEPRVVASSPEFESEITVDPLSQGYVLEDDSLLGQMIFEDAAFELDDAPVDSVAAISKPPVAEPSVTFLPLWKLWLISAGTVMSLMFLRVMCTLWRVKRHRTETPPELLELVQTLSKQFGLRRRVRVLITSSRVGPAVVGLFRPLLILPDVVTNGRSAKELEPIVAHELLHVRRGDLGIGWLQVLVQSLWWFHPLVWLVNRLLNRETERCCDEAVLAELNCSPGTYARCLLNVLEQKRNLTPIPAFPGVKPVELTKQRMERIMKLGQGCRKKSPWWCWLVVLLLGAVVLPGTARSQSEDLKPETQSVETRTSNAEPANAEQVLTPRVYDVHELLETLREEYQFTPNEAERALEQLVGISLSQLKAAVNPLMPEAKHDPRQCLCSGVSLFAVNTPQGHQQIKKLLELWREHGLYQVTIEGCLATVPVGFLATKMPSNQRVPLEQTESDKITTPALPSLTLSYKEYKELQELIQSDTRSNLIAFPKSTVTHGTKAVVMDVVEYPFIMDFKGEQAQIDFLKVGLELDLTPFVRDKNVTQLEFKLRFSQLVKHESKPLRWNLSGRRIESPTPVFDVARMNVSVMLEPGKTLMLRGLQKGSGKDAEEFVVFLTATASKLNREFLDPVADAQEQQTGTLLFGAGVNSDAGVTGSIVLDERNFDLQSPLIYESGKVIEENKPSLSLITLSAEHENSYREQLEKISTQLDQPWKAEYFERPLSKVLLEFHQKLGVRFVIDRDRIAQAGLSEEVPVNLSLSGVNLRSIFKMVLVDKLAYCTIPVIDTESRSVSSTVLISTRNEIIRLALLMRSRSIRNFNSVEDLQQSLFDKPSERHRLVEKRLDQPIAVKFENTKLIDALKQIANTAGMTVYLDFVSLPKTLSAKTLIKDFQSKDETTLREVLEEICTPLGLIFVIEDEVLKIVDKEWHGDQPVTMVYPFAKLIGTDPRGKARTQKVIALIRETVEPDSWTEENGYQILFNERDLSIIIRHKRKTQETIAELLSKVRLETGANRETGESSPGVDDFRVSVGEGIRRPPSGMSPAQSEPARPWIKKTWAWLKHTPRWKKYDREISVSFDQIPLKQAIEQICAAGDLKFINFEKDESPLDQILKTGYPDVMCFENELAEEAISLSVPVTFSAENKAAIPILEDILKPFGLGLGHLNDVNGKPGGCFEIRTKAFLDRTGWTVIYPVGDLLEKDQSLQAGPTQGVPILDEIPHQEKLVKAKVLIEALEKALTWDHSEANTANGTMKFRESSEALVIQCDRAQHDLIEKLLRERRKLCGIEFEPVLSDDGPRYAAPRYAPPPVNQNPARVFSNPMAAEQIETVQLRFFGPKHVPAKTLSLSIGAFDRSTTSREFRLPGRMDLTPGKKYLLRLTNPLTHDPEFYWTLEIPEWNQHTKLYLTRNAIPLKFTDEDLGQVSANNSVTKVDYIPHSDKTLPAQPATGIETIVSTRLDPGIDPVEEAKRRGTIVAVMRSIRQTASNPVVRPSYPTPQPWTPRKLNWEDGAWKLDFSSDPTDSPERRGVQEATRNSAAHKTDDQNARVIAKVYPVADLVVPIPGTESDPVKDDPILSKLPNQSKLFKAKKKPLSDSAQPLIDLIRKSIEPESWSGEKSVGTIAFHEEKLSLVVRHKESVHQKVSELLTSLRRRQDFQVTLECLTVQFEKNSFSDFWTNVGIEIEHLDASAKNSMKPLIFHGVKRDDFRSKIDQFEAAQVLSFPKLTVFNGVGAQIQISGAGTDEEAVPMMHYMIVPTISEDRRTIDVKFAVNPANTLDALTKAKSMTIPDGTSVLIEVTDELLSGQKRTGVPEVDKALRELKKKELGVRTFVLLTPRIIIQEEEEELLGIPQSKAEQPASDSNTRVGTVTPRIIIQEEEEALLKLPQPAAEPKDRSPAPAPVPANPSP